MSQDYASRSVLLISCTRTCSAAQDLQWYEYDLQLAAELGKALLERNQDLEGQLSEAEETTQTQQTEIQFLVQKLDSVKNINETRY